jgi:small GTP-binding protein
MSMADKKVALKAIKIGLLGDSQVGKTALCRALMNYDFDPEIISTIGNIKLETRFELKDGNEIKLILWDSAGQERFRSVALNTLKAVKGIILVFDVTLKASFDNVNSWLNEISENLNDPCLVLFGNKIDRDKDEWEVTQEEAKKFAEERNLTYFETSAKTKEGLKEGFSYIVNEAYEKIKGNSNTNNNVIVLENKEEENEGENNKDNVKQEVEEIKTSTGCFGWRKKKKKKKESSK